MPAFRTPTGQTGPDAYMYEAAQISNHLRALNARAARLAAMMAAEMPEDVSHVRWSISSPKYPDATSAMSRDALIRVLDISGYAVDAPLLGSIARAISTDIDDNVVRQGR